MSTTFHRVLALAAVTALPLAACGGDEYGGGDAATDGILVTAVPGLRFDPEALTAPAGRIDFTLVNADSQPHSFVIDGHEGDLKLTVGTTDSGGLELPAGEYEYYCDVAGHRGGGMEGTLTLE